MKYQTLTGVRSFLERNPLMDEVRSANNHRVFRGKYRLGGKDTEGRILEQWFDLELVIPTENSRGLPVVTEFGGKIPRLPEYHVNGDGSLCLGSPVRMAKDLAGKDMGTFEVSYLVPYLFKVVAKLRGISDGFLGGELAHGLDGLLDDLGVQIGILRTSVVKKILEMALKKKRIANKICCPCGCGRRFGRCPIHLTVNGIRNTMPKALIRTQLSPKHTATKRKSTK